MKKYHLFYILLLLFASCNSDETGTPNTDNGQFSVEIMASNESPALSEPVTFYIKTSVPRAAQTVEWDWGDGGVDMGTSATHAFEEKNEYTVSVKAIGSNGYTATATKSIKVFVKSLSAALKDFDFNKTWLCAHRCITGDAAIPENSIAALNRCIALGNVVNLVEIDPRITKDGVMVVMHDPTVNRTTNGTGDVSDLTYEQVKKLRLKLPNGTVTNDSVPSFRDFLLAAKDKMWINIDIVDKVPYEPLYEIVKEYGMLDQILFYINNNSNAINFLLTASPAGIPFTYTSSASAAVGYKDIGISITQLSAANVLSTDLARIAAENGMVVYTNTLAQNGITIDNDMQNNDFSGIDVMLGKGVNVFQTNYSPILHEYLRAKNKR
jgi:glycerophosphoryl diester phosphodiesterase